MSHDTSQDFDVNITPIIDSFTVLITFMLASASFLSVGIFDAGITDTTGGMSGKAQVYILMLMRGGRPMTLPDEPNDNAGGTPLSPRNSTG